MKCSIMLHFIWVFTVCILSTCLGVSWIQRVNWGAGAYFKRETVKPVLTPYKVLWLSFAEKFWNQLNPEQDQQMDNVHALKIIVHSLL